MAALVGSVQRPVKPLGQPEQFRGSGRSRLSHVGKVERKAAGAQQVDRIQARFRKTGGLGQAEIRTQGRLKRRQHHHVVAGGIVPIPDPLAPTAVGCVAGHGAGQAFQCRLENLPGQLWFVLRDGQRPGRHAAVADLVPVVFGPHPPPVGAGTR